jgi:hypothetical protein
MMKPEEQRIAIAEACGWQGGYYGSIPDSDYLNDLNAMHEVEETLSEGQRLIHEHYLADSSIKAGNFSHWPLIHATAAQRAEAFLKTLGKWEEP